MTQQTTDLDPFAGGGEKTPALSFADAPVGTTYHFTVTARPELLQTKNFETDELEFWPDGNKKMAAVLTVTVDELGGEARSIWARKPSALYRALQDAEKAAELKWGPGVRGSVTYTGEKPNEKNPRLNPQKLYSATASAPDPFAETPAYGTPPAQAAPPVARTLQAVPPAQAPNPAASAALAALSPADRAALLAQLGAGQATQEALPPF